MWCDIISLYNLCVVCCSRLIWFSLRRMLWHIDLSLLVPLFYRVWVLLFSLLFVRCFRSGKNFWGYFSAFNDNGWKKINNFSLTEGWCDFGCDFVFFDVHWWCGVQHTRTIDLFLCLWVWNYWAKLENNFHAWKTSRMDLDDWKHLDSCPKNWPEWLVERSSNWMNDRSSRLRFFDWESSSSWPVVTGNSKTSNKNIFVWRARQASGDTIHPRTFNFSHDFGCVPVELTCVNDSKVQTTPHLQWISSNKVEYACAATTFG